jgi:asparagine synthase (glutamine-hydrolysing)
MLLAARAIARGQPATDVVDRVSRTWGKPQAAIRRADAAVVACWRESAGGVADEGNACVVQGWIDPSASNFSPTFLPQAKGDFALLSLHDDGILLATGRGGGYRPIYVTWPSGELVVACTRLSPLRDLLPTRPVLDREYLAACLLSRWPQLPESTPYAGIRRVPMGEAWLVRPGKQPERWPTVAPMLERELRDDGHLDVPVRQAITDAVRRSHRNAGHLAVEVSGGLDSSLLLSLLVALARAGEIPSPPDAFTYNAAAPAWHDDQTHLQALERHLDVCVHKISPSDATPSVREVMVVDAMPAGSPTLSAAKAIGATARARGVDVVLVGEGGDRVLDGDLRSFGELARRGEILRALEGALKTRGGTAYYQGRLERLARFFARPLAEPLVPRFALDTLRRLRRRPPSWAGPALARHIDAAAPPPMAPAILNESPAERYQRLLGWPGFTLWSEMRLQEELVGGYAVRAPLVDDEFLRFAATLPPLSLMQGGFVRGLMREAMRDLVPEQLRLRETKGTFYFFTEQVLAGAGGLGVFADLADVRMLADLELVEPRPFRQFFDRFRSTRARNATYQDLWQVLSVEAFLRRHAGEGQAEPA